MTFTTNDQNFIIFNFIYKPVFLCDPSTPISFELMFKRLRLASTCIRCSPYLLDKRYDLPVSGLMNNRPIDEIIKGILMKGDDHNSLSLAILKNSSSLKDTFLSSISFIALSKRSKYSSFVSS